jgi:hypothetical protein
VLFWPGYLPGRLRRGCERPKLQPSANYCCAGVVAPLPAAKMHRARRAPELRGCPRGRVVALGVSVHFFLQPGAALTGVYALAVGLGLTGAGVYMLRKAATQRG